MIKVNLLPPFANFFLVLLIRKLFICFVEDIYFFHPHVSILQSAAVNVVRKDVIFVIIEN